jgi:CubicO group peptidase (beta-lactamase class C family)
MWPRRSAPREEWFSGIDQIMGFPSTWALGYSIGRLGADPQESSTTFGYGGVGGSYAYADTATGVAFALTKNRLSPDFGVAECVSGVVMGAVSDD